MTSGISVAEASWRLIRASIRPPEGSWWHQGKDPLTAALILPMSWIDGADSSVFGLHFGATEVTITFHDKTYSRHLKGYYFTQLYADPAFPDLILKKARAFLALYKADQVKVDKQDRHNNLWTNLIGTRYHGYYPPTVGRGHLRRVWSGVAPGP